mgnify:CR=1 FL=1|jgi:hypothetical protein
MFSEVLEKDLGSTPAAVNIRTGVLYINPRVFNSLSKAHKVFVLAHELGHWELQTKDEFAADKYAFAIYSRLGYPLSEAIKAQTKVFPYSTDEQLERSKALLFQAQRFDGVANQGKSTTSQKKRAMNAETTYNQYMQALTVALESGDRENAYKLSRFLSDTSTRQAEKKHFDEIANGLVNFEGEEVEDDYYTGAASGYAGADESSFLGMGKDAKEARKQKQALKQMKAEAKAQSQLIRANAKQTRADAKKSLADQGITSSLNLGGIMDTVGSVAGKVMGTSAVGDILGGLSGGGAGTPPPPPADDVPEKNNTWLYVGGGAAVLLIIGVIVWLVMRKK